MRRVSEVNMVFSSSFDLLNNTWEEQAFKDNNNNNRRIDDSQALNVAQLEWLYKESFELKWVDAVI